MQIILFFLFDGDAQSLFGHFLCSYGHESRVLFSACDYLVEMLVFPFYKTPPLRISFNIDILVNYKELVPSLSRDDLKKAISFICSFSFFSQILKKHSSHFNQLKIPIKYVDNFFRHFFRFPHLYLQIIHISCVLDNYLTQYFVFCG